MLQFFNILEIYSPLLPISVFLFSRGAKPAWHRILITYSVLYIILAGYANELQSNTENTTWVYVILILCTFSYFLFQILYFTSKKLFSKIYWGLLALVTAVTFFNTLWYEGGSAFNSLSSGLSCLILLVTCVYYYRMQLENPKFSFIDKKASFWIVSGIFLYSAGCLMVYLSFRYLIEFEYKNNEKETEYLLNGIWNIQDVIILITNMLFSKGLLCKQD